MRGSGMPKITIGITITGLSGNWAWDDGLKDPLKDSLCTGPKTMVIIRSALGLHLSVYIFHMRGYMDRRGTQPKRVTLPTWGPPPPCKQALNPYRVSRSFRLNQKLRFRLYNHFLLLFSWLLPVLYKFKHCLEILIYHPPFRTTEFVFLTSGLLWSRSSRFGSTA